MTDLNPCVCGETNIEHWDESPYEHPELTFCTKCGRGVVDMCEDVVDWNVAQAELARFKGIATAAEALIKEELIIEFCLKHGLPLAALEAALKKEKVSPDAPGA